MPAPPPAPSVGRRYLPVRCPLRLALYDALGTSPTGGCRKRPWGPRPARPSAELVEAILDGARRRHFDSAGSSADKLPAGPTDCAPPFCDSLPTGKR